MKNLFELLVVSLTVNHHLRRFIRSTKEYNNERIKAEKKNEFRIIKMVEGTERDREAKIKNKN